jgi:hypothetical protein
MTRKEPASRGEQHSVPPAEQRPASAPREHLDLMSKHQQLDFPFEIATT